MIADMESPVWKVVAEVLRLAQQAPDELVDNVRRGAVQRELCDAMGAEYDARKAYDAEIDARVAWVREVIHMARIGRPRWKTEHWPLVEYLMNDDLETIGGNRGGKH